MGARSILVQWEILWEKASDTRFESRRCCCSGRSCELEIGNNNKNDKYQLYEVVWLSRAIDLRPFRDAKITASTFIEMFSRYLLEHEVSA